MTHPVDLHNPEFPRIADVAQTAQKAMYDHLAATNELQTTYSIIIVASKTTPGAMQLQACGIDEEDAITVLRSVLDANDRGHYRTIDLTP